MHSVSDPRVVTSYSFILFICSIFLLFQNKINTNSVTGADQDILGKADQLEVKDKAVLVLVELLMNEKAVTQIKQHKKLFFKVCTAQWLQIQNTS